MYTLYVFGQIVLYWVSVYTIQIYSFKTVYTVQPWFHCFILCYVFILYKYTISSFVFLVIVQFIRSNYFVFPQLLLSDFFLSCVNLCLWFSIIFLLIFLSWWNKKCNIINRFFFLFCFLYKKKKFYL